MVHPSFYTLSPIIGVCLIIWFSSRDELVTKLISTKLFVGIGLISYSLYLWHYPIFVLNIFAKFTEGDLLKKLFIFVIIFLLSITTYYFVERPSRNRNISFKKILSIIFIKILIITVFCAYILNLKFHPFLTKNENEHKIFKLKYNYNSYDERKNIFIIGNSYSDDLLNLFYHNKQLSKKYYFYTSVSDKIGANFQVNCLKIFLLKIQKFATNNCLVHSRSNIKKQII